ncbi:N-acyl homoserine lactonase family protein [Dokdonella soli]|uniref:N-acyl homoserine lactonase family protein n=1 Tax=Dokdonella soli TaxID=529810 RepID=A0ABN1IYF3_9GAMM
MLDLTSKGLALSLASMLLAAPLAHATSATQGAKNEVRLYTLDCGHATFKDFGEFADTGEYDGKPGEIADPCFVIRHPKGILLWDTGLGDKFAANTDGAEPEPGVHVTVPVTLLDQLKTLDLAPADVTYVAFSHFHFDHTGNANEFPGSTWILNKAELNSALANPPPFGVSPDNISAYKTAKTQMIDGDYDVFGDGSVRILKAQGHTPGHQVLEVRLKKTGVVILSGDLYHSRANREFARVPRFNVSRADTLASINRVERIVKNTKARFVVQHDPEDFKALPKIPAYLD